MIPDLGDGYEKLWSRLGVARKFIGLSMVGKKIYRPEKPIFGPNRVFSTAWHDIFGKL